MYFSNGNGSVPFYPDGFFPLTWRVSYKNQELLTLRHNLGSPLCFGWVGVVHPFLVFCVVSMWFVCLRSVSCVLNIA